MVTRRNLLAGFAVGAAGLLLPEEPRRAYSFIQHPSSELVVYLNGRLFRRSSEGDTLEKLVVEPDGNVRLDGFSSRHMDYPHIWPNGTPFMTFTSKPECQPGDLPHVRIEKVTSGWFRSPQRRRVFGLIPATDPSERRHWVNGATFHLNGLESFLGKQEILHVETYPHGAT
jgi:hypothetical protein